MTEHGPLIGMPERLMAGDDADYRVRAASALQGRIADQVADAGGRIVMIRADATDADVRRFDGLVVPGGGDVHPSLYGGAIDHPTLFGVQVAQDEIDALVVRVALADGVPVLGICRGMQLMNVVAGGTLHVHLEPSRVAHSPDRATCSNLSIAHGVGLMAGSRIRALFDEERLLVQSAHHQAVDVLGDGFLASATADDGCVEAIESHDPERFALGVQWHPELSDARNRHSGVLVDALVAAAARRTRSSG